MGVPFMFLEDFNMGVRKKEKKNHDNVLIGREKKAWDTFSIKLSLLDAWLIGGFLVFSKLVTLFIVYSMLIPPLEWT